MRIDLKWINRKFNRNRGEISIAAKILEGKSVENDLKTLTQNFWGNLRRASSWHHISNRPFLRRHRFDLIHNTRRNMSKTNKEDQPEEYSVEKVLQKRQRNGKASSTLSTNWLLTRS